jgi:hypothetical protein
MKPKKILSMTAGLIALLLPTLNDAIEPAADNANVKPLFCAFGAIGKASMHSPYGPESELALAVVEISSPRKMGDMTVSSFQLFDKAGKVTGLRRVVGVTEFVRLRAATESEEAYYLHSDSTRPWDGTLPATKIRLCIRVALLSTPIQPVRFRLTIGPYLVEGPVNGGMWDSG